MANKKISELPDASVPLTGAELVPMVQSGVTVQVPASDLVSGVPSTFNLTGVTTPAILSGNTNNWAPSIGAVSRVNASSSNDVEVTGLAGGVDGKVIVLTNIGANNITLMTESGSSTAANRFAQNGDFVLVPGASVMLIYVSALSRWSRIG